MRLIRACILPERHRAAILPANPVVHVMAVDRIQFLPAILIAVVPAKVKKLNID